MLPSISDFLYDIEKYGPLKFCSSCFPARLEGLKSGTSCTSARTVLNGVNPGPGVIWFLNYNPIESGNTCCLVRPLIWAVNILDDIFGRFSVLLNKKDLQDPCLGFRHFSESVTHRAMISSVTGGFWEVFFPLWVFVLPGVSFDGNPTFISIMNKITWTLALVSFLYIKLLTYPLFE